jgi:hypothetical protein
MVMSSPPLVPVVFFAIAGISMFGLWIGSGRRERNREAARSLYRESSFPIWWRNGLGVAPLVGTGMLLFACALLVPRELGAWVLLAGVLLIGLGIALGYRVPAPFLPGWLREEIARGETPVARPSRGDWVLFWLVGPLLVCGIAAIIVLILASPLPS